MGLPSRFLTCVVLLLLVLTIVAPAQTSRGTVTGTVTDATGAVVANATVTLTQQGTNITRETKTNAAGIYRFDAVNLGVYSVKASAPNFSAIVYSDVAVEANQVKGVDFSLQVGKAETVVNVEGQTSGVALQTEEQLRGGAIDTKRLTELPISGQNSLNLMVTIPGVVPSNNGVADGGVGSVNGSRTRSNNFMIDGVENNDISVAGPAVWLLNNDAIQEVSIQTANYSAEFGRTGGAVVNQITKSGSNSLHGTAAWVYLSEVFNASTVTQRNTYRSKLANPAKYPNPVLKPSFKEHIPAFTVGGPVYIPGVYNGKDKTFWFFAGQWDRYSTGAAQKDFTVPTAAGIATLQSIAGTCPNVALYLKSLNGLTAGTQLPGSTPIDISLPSAIASTSCGGGARTGMTVPFGTATREVPQALPSWNLQWRIDHNFTSKHSLMGRVFMDSSSTPFYYMGISRPFDSDLKSTDSNVAINDTYVFSSTMTNELRLAYGRINPQWTVVDATGLGALPTFAFSGSSLSGFGTNSSYPQGRTANNYQLQDTVSKVKGKHTFRFGADFLRQIASQSAPIVARGAITYRVGGGVADSFTNFIDDFAGGSTTNVMVKNYGTARYHPTLFRHAYFFQDAWKAFPTLTLNLGLRYENFGQPANQFLYPVVSLDPSGFTKVKVPADNNNFGPTVGFSWNPQGRDGVLGFLSGNGKAVVRGGFQIGYDTWFNNLLSNMAANAPNNPVNVSIPSNINSGTPRGVGSVWASVFNTMTPAGFLVTQDTSSQYGPNIRNPYTERWSFGVQREVGGGTVVDLSYVGSASHKLFQQKNLNPNTNPTVKADGTYTYGPRLISTLGSRVIRDSSANSNYHSLQAEVRKRYTQTPVGGVTLTSSYTWSKNLSVIDEVFATYSSNATMMTANPLLYNGNRNFDYGPSDNDRRHRFVSTVVWDIRGPKQGFLGHALGGWTVSGIIPIQSATPFTIFNGFDRDADGSGADRPNIGNPNAPIDTRARFDATCSTQWMAPSGTCVSPTDVHWLMYGVYNRNNNGTAKRNSNFTRTGQVVANVDIIKKFKVREGMSLEYRAEIFNIANQMNFNFVPNGTSLNPQTQKAFTSAPFLDYSQTDAGNRSMRMGLKVIF